MQIVQQSRGEDMGITKTEMLGRMLLMLGQQSDPPNLPSPAGSTLRMSQCHRKQRLDLTRERYGRHARRPSPDR